MKKIQILTTCTLFFLVITSCGIFGGHNLAKRFRNTSNVNLFRNATDPQSFVVVDINSYLLKEAKPPELKYNVLSMNREGQAQYIKSLADKFADPKDFIKQMNTNFSFIKKPDDVVRIIPKTIKKSIVFTINRQQYENKDPTTTVFNLPGDRISYLDLALTIPIESSGKFDSWDKFETKNMTINLGKVSSAQQWSANVNLAAQANWLTSLSGSNTKTGLDTSSQVVVMAPTDPTGNTDSNTTTNSTGNSNTTGTGSSKGIQLGGSAGLTYNDSYNTSVDLSSRIIQLSGTLKEKKMILQQEGGVGIDLSGNVVVSVSYEITDDWAKPVRFIKFGDLYDKDKNVIELKELKINDLTVIFPDIQNDLKGTLDYSFLYRQVIHGNRHIPEARQKVTFWHGFVPSNEDKLLDCQPVVLVKKDDIRPKSYLIMLKDDQLAINDKLIQFESVDDASAFLHYLTDLARAKKDLSLVTIKKKAITNDNLDDLYIKTIKL